MKNISRLEFIKTSGSALATASVAPLFSLGNSKKAVTSDTLTIGLIGCRSMGFGDLVNTLRVKGVVCHSLCDIDNTVLEEKGAEVEQMTGDEPALYKDYRRMLEDDDL